VEKARKNTIKNRKGESGKGEKIQYIIPGTIPVEHPQKFTSSREFVVLSRGVPDRPVVWVQSNVESICYIFYFLFDKHLLAIGHLFQEFIYRLHCML
jgi:hypothetical protein